MIDIIVRKSLPTVSDVHVDRPLTNMSEAYFQDLSMGLASTCFPVVPVTNQSNKYFTWNKADNFRDEAQVRAPGTEVPRSGATPSTDSYNCLIYQWGDDIAYEVAANSDPGLNLDQTKTRRVIQTLLRRRERIFAANFLATSKWATDITGVSGSPSSGQVKQWNDAASTPIDDVLAGKTTILKNTGQEPNTLVLGYQVRQKLATNAQVLARITGGQTPNGPAKVSDQQLADLFEVDRILVSKGVYNSAVEGASASMDFIAGKVALLCYSEPSPSIDTASAGMTFVWTGGGNAFWSDYGVRIETMEEPLKRKRNIDGFMNFDQKLTASDLGCFWTSIIA